MVGIDHVVLTHHETAMPLIRRIRELVDPPGTERLVVGEVVTGDIEQQASYCGDGDGVSCTVNFVSVGAGWDRDQWHLLIEGTEDAYADRAATWPSYVLSNHDNPRHRTRYGGSEARARSAAVLLLTVRGTPFLYQGEELGLEDAVIPPGTEIDPGGRDGCRAPIPWEADEPHGWGPAPWLPFPPESSARSAQAQRADAGSVLSLYRELLAARKASPALQQGSLELFARTDLVLAYRRVHGADERIVAVNFGNDPADVGDLAGTVVVGSTGLGAGQPFGGRLGPDEAVVLRP